MGGMHRTQLKKKEIKYLKIKEIFFFFFLSSLPLSLSAVWVEMWVETEKHEIAKQYQ